MKKNREKPPRKTDFTRGFKQEDATLHDLSKQEMVRARGDISRKRTVLVDIPGSGESLAAQPAPPADANFLWGKVLQVSGLNHLVHGENNRIYRCTVRKLIKSLATAERNVIATGDRVRFSPEADGAVNAANPGETDGALNYTQGVILSIEPRHGVLTRISKGKEHVLVANVDQAVFVISLKEPELKPHLVDRFLGGAWEGNLRPVLCFNKSDLVDTAHYQPLVGLYSQLGIPAFFTSTVDEGGLDTLKEMLTGRQSVICGQSGVGKSSMLNGIQPGLGLKVGTVSEVNQKGKHTTTSARLLPLEFGGWVIDTPGIRQFELASHDTARVAGYFPEFRSLVYLCAFPDCSHTHERGCAIQRQVLRRQVSWKRYESYLGMIQKEAPPWEKGRR